MLIVPLPAKVPVDVALTPLPAVLTLRRLALEPREVRIVNVASITIPELGDGSTAIALLKDAGLL